ncbi:MAG TPA: YaiO family outer membrane beta-barrel protein, partial [Chryseosolibacter sp.]|nr:YaiO family outer membrane beta-barrel protein [Chryseosolibacter sp.]
FNDVNVLIYTGSLGWYVKNYWVSLRPYVTSDPISTNGSATVFIRRYFRNPENFVGLIGGFGFSPDFARLQTGYGLGGDNVHKLNSQRTGIVFQKVFQSKWVMNLSFEVARQDLSDETGPLLMTTSTLGLKRKF